MDISDNKRENGVKFIFKSKTKYFIILLENQQNCVFPGAM